MKKVFIYIFFILNFTFLFISNSLSEKVANLENSVIFVEWEDRGNNGSRRIHKKTIYLGLKTCSVKDSQTCTFKQKGKFFEINGTKEKYYQFNQKFSGVLYGTNVSGKMWKKGKSYNFTGTINAKNFINLAKKEPSQTQKEILIDPITTIVVYTKNNNSVFSEATFFKNKIFSKSFLEKQLKKLRDTALTRCKKNAKYSNQDDLSCVTYKVMVQWGSNSFYFKNLEGYTISKIVNRIWDYSYKRNVETQISTKKPEKTNEDIAKLEEEKRKIEEEKRKIEEEKRKIAEAKKKQEEEEKILIIGSGTGFFVNDNGHIITNNHVVEICKMMAAEIDGDPKIFKILATDEQNDLALIKGDYINENFLNLSTKGAVFGEDIVAFGYPLDTELSSSVKLTRGIVSSLSGPKNNISQIQIDAAIQPGNSGGPVLNYEGQVVGVASSGLNKWYMIEKSEYIPENVNFAVAAPTLLSFLKANNVNFGEKKIEVSKTQELAKIGMPSIFIFV